jgi:hypothetical protein
MPFCHHAMLTPNWGYSTQPRPPAPATRLLSLADADAFQALVEHETLLRRRAGVPVAALHLHAEPRAGLHALLLEQRLGDLAGWLQRYLRPSDTVAQWPTGQFGLLLPTCAPAYATRVLNRLLNAPPGPYWPNDWGLDLQLYGRVLTGPQPDRG